MAEAGAVTRPRAGLTLRGRELSVDRSRLLEVAAALAAMAIPLIVALLVLEPWGHFSTVPWYYGGAVPSRFAFDVNFHLAAVKGLLENGWWIHNPALGAPFGQSLYDFPLGGYDVQLLLIKLIGIGPSQVGTVVNLYYLLTFPLTALGAYAGFRWLRISRPTAVVLASLFALLPYHFLRGEYHLFLSLYATAALGAFLTLALLVGEPLLVRRAWGGRGLLKWASRRTLGVLAVCVLIGSTEYYYANLTMVMLVAAALIAAAVARRPAPLVTGVVLVATIAGALTLNLAPSLIHNIQHGKNPHGAIRRPAESEIYSLKISQLVLPSQFHRLAPLARLGRHYATTEIGIDEETAPLGIVGTIGFAWLLVLALLTVAGAARGRASLERHRQASTAAVVALLIGTTGGGSALVAYLFTAQLRAWNRLSLFIAFFSLFAVGLGLDALRRRLGAARRGTLLGVAALAAVLVIGALDETSPKLRPDYRFAAAAFANDGGFVNAIQRQMPAGTMVYQLPYVQFPENPPFLGMQDYDLFKGYIHSSTLRWSYGSVKGRPQADWQKRLDAKPLDQVIAGVSAVGFRGLWIDTAGYADAGASELSAAQAATGAAPLVSSDKRLYFFDLRPSAAKLAKELGPAGVEKLRRATLGPAA